MVATKAWVGVKCRGYVVGHILDLNLVIERHICFLTDSIEQAGVVNIDWVCGGIQVFLLRFSAWRLGHIRLLL